MNNSGALRSHTPAMGSLRPLEIQALLPWHREGARGFLPQPGGLWRHRVPEPQGQSWGTVLCLLPRAQGGVLGVQGGCAGSGTHLHQAGRGFHSCWWGGESRDDPVLAKEGSVIIYKLAMRGLVLSP